MLAHPILELELVTELGQLAHVVQNTTFARPVKWWWALKIRTTRSAFLCRMSLKTRRTTFGIVSIFFFISGESLRLRAYAS